MKTDLNREQILTIVERARYERSLAAGEMISVAAHKALARLAHAADRFLHLLLMSPTVRH
jgi:hypothetical protein